MQQGEFYVLLFGAVGGLAVIVTPILKLNSNIVKLNSSIENLYGDIKEQKNKIDNLEFQQIADEKTLVEHKYRLENHEKRIEKLERE